MYSNYHAFHIIVQSLFHSQRTCNIEKAVLVSGANYKLESQRVFIWKWSVLSRIPSITLGVGLVGMFLNGFLYTRLWGRSKSSSVLKVLKQNFILSLCYSSGRTPYLKNMFLSGNFLLQAKILPRVQNASSHTTLQEPHNILTLLSRTRAFTLLFLFSKEILFSCLCVLSWYLPRWFSS